MFSPTNNALNVCCLRANNWYTYHNHISITHLFIAYVRISSCNRVAYSVWMTGRQNYKNNVVIESTVGRFDRCALWHHWLWLYDSPQALSGATMGCCKNSWIASVNIQIILYNCNVPCISKVLELRWSDFMIFRKTFISFQKIRKSMWLYQRN